MVAREPKKSKKKIATITMLTIILSVLLNKYINIHITYIFLFYAALFLPTLIFLFISFWQIKRIDNGFCAEKLFFIEKKKKVFCCFFCAFCIRKGKLYIVLYVGVLESFYLFFLFNKFINGRGKAKFFAFFFFVNLRRIYRVLVCSIILL